jgi:hypothetical protein
MFDMWCMHVTGIQLVGRRMVVSEAKGCTMSERGRAYELVYRLAWRGSRALRDY